MIGPHSRPEKLALTDGRSAEGKFMKRVRDDLAQHVGGRPSATQKMIIAQIAMLTLQIRLMDREAIKRPKMTATQSKHYLAWSNTLARLLRQLGLKSTPTTAPSLASIDWSAHRSAAA